MSLGLKMFNVVGIGFLAGEVVDANKDTIFLKFPGVLQGYNMPEGTGFGFIDFVPDFFPNYRELLEKTSLPRGLILLQGDLDLKLVQVYEIYVKKLIKKLTGLHIVGAGALGDLPKDGKTGEPIIK